MGAHQSKPSSSRKRLVKGSKARDDATTSLNDQVKQSLAKQSSTTSASGQNDNNKSTQAHSQCTQAGSQSAQRHPQTSPPQREGEEQQSPRPVTSQSGIAPVSALEAHNARYREARGAVDKQTGERQDFTNVWHSLAYKASDDSLDDIAEVFDDEKRESGEKMVAGLSRELWQHIASFLDPNDAASLAVASETLLNRLGNRPFIALKKPENFQFLIAFLLNLDAGLPHHLLCFNCGTYHFRTQPGLEKLQGNAVLNPLFDCPRATEPTVIIPRARIVPGWSLPFSFAQLAVRAHKYGAEYGIPASSLGRRWTDMQSGWTHSTSFHVNPKTGHLLMRVTSQTPAEPDLPPAGMRHLIFDKANYTPHYSVCTHWRDGELVPLTKCALGHIPGAGPSLAVRMATRAKGEMMAGFVGQQKNNNNIVIGGGTGPAGQCAQCRPMRRCPECPTEYLIELRLTEDKRRRETGDDGSESPTFSRRRASGPRLVNCISVTRWSDLGDGRTPFHGEWAACTGVEGAARYDSFKMVGGRTVAGTFEARFGDSAAGQRVLSLNPSMERKGEKGYRWY